jgi:hypothetical protein
VTDAIEIDPRRPPLRASYSRFQLKLPVADTEDVVAQLLAQRGHRWVIAQEGVVRSLCVNPPVAWEKDSNWGQDCETAAVESIARTHGGYLGSGSEGSGEEPERSFLRDGRTPTIELDEQTALDRRREAIAAVPQRQPEPAAAPVFETVAESSDLDFRVAIREISQRLYGDPESALRLAAPDGSGGGERQVPGSAYEFLADLHNTVMPQDSCYPDTVEAVPLLVELATRDDVTDDVRNYACFLLFSGASNGLRMIAVAADQFVAQGEEFIEYDAARLTREAVGARVGELFARWDRRSESVRMSTARLAAVFPEQAAASPIMTDLAVFAERWPGTRRAAALRLALAAARADDAATIAEITAIEAWHWRGPLAAGSPLAPPQARALMLLFDDELDALA